MSYNQILVRIMGFLSLIGRVPRWRSRLNRKQNLRTIGKHIPNGYIEDQRNWKDVRFGFWNMAFSGCEIFAVYNALLALEQRFGAEELLRQIQEFEGKGSMLQGGFGCSPKSIASYFQTHGYRIAVTTKDTDASIQALERDGSVYILTAFNDGHNFFKQIHTVCITKEGEGYWLHNGAFVNSHGKYLAKHFDSLPEAVHGLRPRSRLISLLVVTKE